MPLPARWYICTCPHVLLHQRLNGVNCAEHWSLYINKGRQHCDSWLKFPQTSPDSDKKSDEFACWWIPACPKETSNARVKERLPCTWSWLLRFCALSWQKMCICPSMFCFFISPKSGTIFFHVRHYQCHSMSSLCLVLWFNPRNFLPFKLMRIMQVNPGFFKTVTTRQGLPMCRWHRSYLHALACPLTAIFAIRSEYCGNLHINEMSSRPSLHWSSISTSSTTSLARKGHRKGVGSRMDLQNI